MLKSSQKLVYREMWVFLKVLVGYRTNGNRLRVREKVDGFPFWLQVYSSETTSNKKSVIVKPVIFAFIRGEEGD